MARYQSLAGASRYNAAMGMLLMHQKISHDPNDETDTSCHCGWRHPGIRWEQHMTTVLDEMGLLGYDGLARQVALDRIRKAAS